MGGDMLVTTSISYSFGHSGTPLITEKESSLMLNSCTIPILYCSGAHALHFEVLCSRGRIQHAHIPVLKQALVRVRNYYFVV